MVSLDVWKDFASQGLYIFDLQPHAGPYRKMKQSEGEIPSALQHDILEIERLPFFNGIFRQVESIAVEDSSELTTTLRPYMGSFWRSRPFG
ncbi:hypothetical protein [Hymenobacter yonginensis]|uniref:Uncharacterized protein n=1 Tax=Hymenobacter yonginensis TaxID=748197 RepID=A0ABY7PVI7_9BACT|nr:hypothetical protein [Hymenobacter yonginensis]WBO86675.1 hypothetical protein O9Z63_20555 [Hymenobacter yonginensis]